MVAVDGNHFFFILSLCVGSSRAGTPVNPQEHSQSLCDAPGSTPVSPWNMLWNGLAGVSLLGGVTRLACGLWTGCASLWATNTRKWGLRPVAAFLLRHNSTVSTSETRGDNSRPDFLVDPGMVLIFLLILMMLVKRIYRRDISYKYPRYRCWCYLLTAQMNTL